MLTPINEAPEKAQELWGKLRTSLNKAVKAVRPVQKGRFTVEPAMRTSTRTPRVKKFGRFEVINNTPQPRTRSRPPPVTKNYKRYFQRKRAKLQKSVNKLRQENRNKYQQEVKKLKNIHKAELNNLGRKHEQNENALYNKHQTIVN